MPLQRLGIHSWCFVMSRTNVSVTAFGDGGGISSALLSLLIDSVLVLCKKSQQNIDKVGRKDGKVKF